MIPLLKKKEREREREEEGIDVLFARNPVAPVIKMVLSSRN